MGLRFGATAHEKRTGPVRFSNRNRNVGRNKRSALRRCPTIAAAQCASLIAPYVFLSAYRAEIPVERFIDGGARVARNIEAPAVGRNKKVGRNKRQRIA